MANLLKSTSNELDIEKFRKYPSLLSNVQLTSQLLVKCLAKTTQGIDKISNLQ
ncbi:type III secretion system rspB [Pseudomonas fluorescens]|uniref:Type III secretion system rspB n=1 Tax=Pseudomonas fluorescens TaxID=294 RepID=A0A7Z6MXW5_PSEFL|nr:type III secretion system rspB [Pseudomonas fluorescens]